MTTVLFVRHGETDWNRQGRFQGSQDIPLNDEGRRQARHLASAWHRPADLVIASPLARARETAELLAPALGLTLSSTDRLLVERHYGQAEGLSLAERHERYGTGPIPGAETHDQVLRRARAFLDQMGSAHPGRTVVAVSHGGFINVALALVSKGVLGTGKTFLANTSVSEVVFDGVAWSVRASGVTFGRRLLGLRE